MTLSRSVTFTNPFGPFPPYSVGGLRLCFLALALFATWAKGAQSNIPPFVASGDVTVIRLKPFETNFVTKTDGHFSFSYTSNNLWQVQFTYEHFYDNSSPSTSYQMGNTIDYRRIPDGTRQVIVEATNAKPPISIGKPTSPSATTSLLPFPPIGSQALFVPWLALCPIPELPFVDATHIRFDFSPRFLNEPLNAGGYSLSYIAPEMAFISTLNVTNNGMVFQPNDSPFRYQGPYKEGFNELSYVVLDVTNCAGIKFPGEAVFNQFAPLPGGKSKNDIYPAVVTRIRTKQIDVHGQLLTLLPTPQIIVALDSRPTGLNNGITVNYRVTNDTWLSLTNKKMVTIANIVRHQAGNRLKEEQKYPRNRLIVASILGALTLLPICVLFFRFVNKEIFNQQQKLKKHN